MTKISIYKFIATPEDGVVYKNKLKVGDKEIIMNTHLDGNDKDLLQLQGVVKHAPLYNLLSIKEDDRILVQHNTFRVYTDMQGEYVHGNVLQDGEYFISPDLIFAYNDGKEWISTNGWIFVKPISYKKDGVLKSVETIRPDTGVVAFNQDPKFIDNTIEIGDTINFGLRKKVTCLVDGETYLRVRIKDILLNHGRTT